MPPYQRNLKQEGGGNLVPPDATAYGIFLRVIVLKQLKLVLNKRGKRKGGEAGKIDS